VGGGGGREDVVYSTVLCFNPNFVFLLFAVLLLLHLVTFFIFLYRHWSAET